MARKTLIHKHTNLTTTTGGILSPKLPTVGTLEKGEIAVNYKNGYETLSIENDAGEIIPFASWEQILAYIDTSNKIYTVDLSVREDLLASPLSSDTLSALNAMRADQNSENSLILFKASQDGSTLVPAYITQYGSTFKMYLYYENKEICVTAGANVPALDWAVEVTELDKAYYVVNATFVEDIPYPDVGPNEATVDHYAEDIIAAYNEGKMPIISFGENTMIFPFIGYNETEENLYTAYFGISINNKSYLAAVETDYAVLTVTLIPTFNDLGILTIRVNGTALVADSGAVNITSIPSSIVTQDSTHRFVTDTEKNKWNSAIQGVKVNGTSITPDSNKIVDITIPDGELSSEYEPSVLENEDLYLAPGDTYEEAFGKLHKAILDDEETTAASLNELNDRIPTIDTELDEDSENPVQNKVITQTILDNEYVTSTALNNLNNRIETKQNTLISGTNIKTINGNSLLGSGNITISGGGSSTDNFDIIEVNCNFRADINKDGSISTLDATSMTLGGIHGTTPTDDVNNDGSITITDATSINALTLANSTANILFNLETNPYSLITSSFTNSKIPILRLIFIGGNTFDIFVQKYSNNTYLGEGLYYADVPANGEGTGLGNLIKKIFVSVSETSTIGIIGSIVTTEGLATKQATLVSGTNIKTINNESILGSGNITIQGSSGGGDVNVIEIVKVNGTALTPDANKAVDITVPTPYIMEISESEGSITIEEHAYETLSNAISEGRDVYLKEGSYLYALNEYGEDFLYFTHADAEEFFIESIVIYSDNAFDHFFSSLCPAFINSATTLGAGDRLVFTDASNNNGISRSPIAFDGSTTTKALTPKGTWETFLQSYTETDPTVPAWAKAASKPTYTAAEVGALPDTYTPPVTSVNGQTGAVNLTIPAAVTESTVSGWGFTKNAGTITGITMNGSSKGTSGVVNLGTVITSETSLSKGTTSGSGNAVTDISVSGHTITLTKGSTFLTSHQNIKTINNNSLVGTGNVSIDTLPTVTASDNGKILQVVNGAWTLVTPTAIYSGTSAPNNSTGNNGDLYLQTS